MSVLLHRERLLTMVAQTPGLWIVEACAGSGKSILARQLAREHGWRVTPKLPIDLDELDNPVLADLTDHLWDPPADEVAFLRARRDESPTVVTARAVTPAARRTARDLGARWLRAADLWFDDDELRELAIARLGPDDGRKIAGSLRPVTDAWPAAVTACLDEAALHTAPIADFAAASAAAFHDVLSQHLDDLTGDDRAALEALAAFNRFDDDIATTLGGPELMQRLLLHGVPLRDGGRWKTLSTMAGSTLRGLTRSLPQLPASVFGALASNGHVLDAAEAALDLGQPETSAEILAGLSAEASHLLDPARTAVVWTRLGPVAASHPRTALVRARQLLATGELSAAIDVLRAGVDPTHDASSLEPLEEELRAELALALFHSGDLEAASSLVRGPDFRMDAARARQLEVRAGLNALTMRRDLLEQAARTYHEAEQLWLVSGQFRQAGWTLHRLAMEVTSRVGRLSEALVLLDRCLASTGASSFGRANVQLARVRLLAQAGRRDEAEAALQELDALSGVLLRGFPAALAALSRGLLASHQGDEFGVDQAIADTSSSLGDLANHAPGALLHGDAVEMYARCGAADKVTTHLAALRAHPKAEPPDVAWAEITATCRTGDAVAGLQLVDTFRSGDLMTPGGDWRLALAESIAHRRLGQTEAAQRSLATARDLADLVDAAETLEATETPLAAEPVGTQQQHRVWIRFLPDFSVEVDGASIELPAGHVRTLLKLVALRGGRLMNDEIIDALWPDGDPAVGRRRIRNVLARLRTACGDVVVRDGEVLDLADDVGTDFDEWWQESARVLATGEGVQAALAVAPNLLLPSDRYEEWMQALQRRYQQQLLRLVDRAVSDAIQVSDLDLVVRMQRRALEIDPWDLARIDETVDLLTKAGRSAEAAEFSRLGQDLA